MTKTKRSLLTGALAGSFGIFISKLLGLFYVVPLNYLAGEANMAFYSITYTYYDLLLKVCGAGIPFAIAALAAKYLSREDYKTVLLIKRLGVSLIMALSFIVTAIFLMVSGPLSSSILGDQATASDIEILNNLFYILALALILVPFLSSIRGYYQGLKLMKEYGVSQVLEQIVRVSGIIFLGLLFVNILRLDSIWAIYMAILAAAIGALFAVIYILISGRSIDAEILELAKDSEREARPTKDIIKEIMSLGIPYLVISFLGTTSSLINSNFFLDYASDIIGYDQAMLALGILQVNTNKLAAIPQVLTLGFSAGLVPYLTEAFERNDLKTLRSYIAQILETVLYFLIPIVAWFVVYARPIYYIMYGGSNLDMGQEIFLVSCLTTFTDTIAPIISSMCITLRLRKLTIVSLALSTIVKLLTFYVAIDIFGYNGMAVSTAIASLFAIVFNLYVLKYSYQVSYGRVLKRMCLMFIAAAISCIPILLDMCGILSFSYEGRVVCIIILGLCGIISLVVYIGISFSLGLPQALWNKGPKDYLEDIKMRLKKSA